MRYLVELTPPKRIVTGYSGDHPIYQDCAGCSRPDAVIYGAIADEQMKVCVLRHVESPFFENAYYCQACFEAMTVGVGERVQ